jgi:hypothetical protein
MRKILTVALFSLVAMASAADARSGVKIGVLSCEVDGGVGFIIGSSKGVDCVYQPASGARAEHYSSSIGKLGIDIRSPTVPCWRGPYLRQARSAEGRLEGLLYRRFS